MYQPPPPSTAQSGSPIPPQVPIVKKKNNGNWIAILCFAVAIGFAFYSFFWRDYQRDKLIERGLPATAVILNADPTGNTYNSQPEIRLKLRVSPPQGQPYETETEMVINPIYAPQFQPGKSVKVKYDPEDRSKVAVEETENGQR